MIRRINESEIEECAAVIRTSFATVAKEFNLTKENCPTHTSFIPFEKLKMQFERGCPMFAYIDDDKIVGYFSLIPQKDGNLELNNLAVLPNYRHKGYGAEMIRYAVDTAKAMNVDTIRIGIIEESMVLKNWYIKNGFIHIGIHKFEHLPFMVGFMEMKLC